MPVAIITGASKGLGRALGAALAEHGWDLVLDARTTAALAEAAKAFRVHGTQVVALAGDVTDQAHRADLVKAARGLGGLDLLVNNASALGAEPLVPLRDVTPGGLRLALETNVVAALELVQEALGPLRDSPAAAVINISSDAAVEAYETWGGYGASKAALNQLSAVLAVEEPWLRVWAVDPGDMCTDLYRAAVPSDDGQELRPLPESVVPAFLRLLAERPVSGGYPAAALSSPMEASSSPPGVAPALVTAAPPDTASPPSPPAATVGDGGREPS